MPSRHKVFVSYHHDEDQVHRNRFEQLFAKHFDIMVSKSVDTGDIDPSLSTETIRQKIRDEYIRDATVTIVLVGKYTWQRKHVDWEIYSSLRDTKLNSRCGLLGIFLPSFDLPNNRCDPHKIPPRLYDNVKLGYAKMHGWSNDPATVKIWINDAFERRNQNPPPNLSRALFGQNRTGNSWQ